MLDKDTASGFPKKQALWGGRRYWPAVEHWFQLQNGIVAAPGGNPGRPDIVERAPEPPTISPWEASDFR
jgi:hypothetical protein